MNSDLKVCNFGNIVLLMTKHPHRFSNLLKVMEGMHETCSISKDMSMRGLRRSQSEPAIIACASVIHYHELVSDNFSPPLTSSMEDKLNGCINEINNSKRVNTWVVIKNKLEEKGDKSFTTEQLEESIDESLEKQVNVGVLKILKIELIMFCLKTQELNMSREPIYTDSEYDEEDNGEKDQEDGSTNNEDGNDNVEEVGVDDQEDEVGQHEYDMTVETIERLTEAPFHLTSGEEEKYHEQVDNDYLVEQLTERVNQLEKERDVKSAQIEELKLQSSKLEAKLIDVTNEPNDTKEVYKELQ
ncbi:hypothetical protein L1049_027988 [Liquidambar formosana]|uniref:Uncharacterized protein n=1 Tax=Liquidambar formosana TaxID=63359 RepID=A0AAP0WVZ4_LIQFO